MCDGEVLEINEDVEANAALVNEDAEGAGWLMKVKLADSSQLKSLMDEESYKNSI